MSLIPYIPVGVTIIGIFGGAVVYNWQKSVDRQIELKRERRDLYRRYVCIFEELDHKLISPGPQEVETFNYLNELEKITAEILIAAPDNVVGACMSVSEIFLRLANSSFRDREDFDFEEMMKIREELDEAKIKIVSSMRRDIFESTKIGIATIEASLSGFTVSLGLK